MGDRSRCVLLNGLPASGKTTVCRELQRLRHQRGELWLHVPLDMFQQMLPTDVRLCREQYQVGIGSMYDCIERLAAGADLIIELTVRDDPSVREIYAGLRSILIRASGAPILVTLTCDERIRRLREARRAGGVDESSFTSSLDPATQQNSDLILRADETDPAALAERVSALLGHRD